MVAFPSANDGERAGRALLTPTDQGTLVLPVVHMHTGSETLRLVLAWCPEVVGPAVQAKKSYLCQHLDHVW